MVPGLCHHHYTPDLTSTRQWSSYHERPPLPPPLSAVPQLLFGFEPETHFLSFRLSGSLPLFVRRYPNRVVTQYMGLGSRRFGNPRRHFGVSQPIRRWCRCFRCPQPFGRSRLTGAFLFSLGFFGGRRACRYWRFTLTLGHGCAPNEGRSEPNRPCSGWDWQVSAILCRDREGPRGFAGLRCLS